MTITYINKTFPKSDLSAEKSYVSSDIHLRFELGLGFENGTIERVNQSVSRATELFEKIFDIDDEIIILIKSFEYDGAKEFYEPTQGYLNEQFKKVNINTINANVELESETGDYFNPDLGKCEHKTITTKHIQKIFTSKVHDIDYQNIFRGIANLEMGFDPSISETIYFINKRNNTALHMYDDRGCVIHANNKDDIKHLYTEYYDWLVDYHIDTFIEIFG